MTRLIHEYLTPFILIVFQIAILNNIQILGFAPPFIMIYPIIFAPISRGRNISLLIAFLFGLIADLFTNTLGINSFSFMTIAFMRGFLLSPYKAHEVSQADIPTLKTLGVSRFFSFVSILTFSFCSLIYFLELSSFSNIDVILIRVIISSISSVALFTFLQFMNTKR